MSARGALQLLEYQVQDDYALSPELEDAVAVLSAALDERERLRVACEALLNILPISDVKPESDAARVIEQARAVLIEGEDGERCTS